MPGTKDARAREEERDFFSGKVEESTREAGKPRRADGPDPT
jgi:hypothetical protein